MKIDLTPLLDGTEMQIEFQDTLDVKDLDLKNTTLTLIDSIDIKGSLYKTAEGIFIHANLAYHYEDQCSRCLKPVTMEEEQVLSGKLEEKPSDGNDNNESLDEDEMIIYYEGTNLELKGAIINTILLSLPMKILCSPNCKGFCPNCGQNLNEDQCECEEDNIDPRLAKLKDLFN